MNSYPTFRLFSRPTWSEGFGSIIDMAGNDLHYNRSESEAEADFRALLSDWKAIGIDISTAIDHYKTNQKVDEY